MKIKASHDKLKAPTNLAASKVKTKAKISKAVTPGRLSANSVFLRPIKVNAAGSAW